MNPAREPEDDWHWDDPFARQLEAPDSGGRPSEPRVSTFDELIDGWRREGPVPVWPEIPGPDAPGPDAPRRAAAPERAGPDAAEPTAPDSGTRSEAAQPAAEPSAAPAGGPNDPDDDHYVPPEPPPLPKFGAPAVVGLGLLGLGLLLLIAPWWIGVSKTFAIPLGLLALASGLGWLVLRLWPTPPPTGDGDGADDGAVI